jgi:multiple antibiotic resistance protein
MSEFILCFIPVLIAIDPLGVLPFFMTLTHGIETKRVKQIALQSVFTALAVSLAFLVLGKLILRYLGVSVGDFMIAGGVLLFVISITDMLILGKRELAPDPDIIGAVPIGVPLVAGPALFTTAILLVDTHGFVMTASAMVTALVITGTVFYFSQPIHRILGSTGAKTISKLSSLLLAAIAVMMVRKGIIVVLSELGR